MDINAMLVNRQIDTLEELFNNSRTICQLFGLEGELYFTKLIGGICNAPVYVYQLKENVEVALGVFKLELENHTFANKRFDALESMTKNGFIHNPLIIKNAEESYLTKIGSRYYSLIEYIKPDPGFTQDKLGFKDMLKLTGLFHQYAQQIDTRENLVSSRLDLHLARQAICDDPLLVEFNPAFFQGEIWRRVLSLYRFYSTEMAGNIFNSLHKQFIIGDNHQSNIVYRDGIPYFVDLDARRQDLRLYDFSSFIRGGTEAVVTEYFNLAANNELFDVIDKNYSIFANPLMDIEKLHFHFVMAFSYIEFFSWVLNKIKLEINNGHHQIAQNLFLMFATRVNQVIKMLDLKLIDECYLQTNRERISMPANKDAEIIKELSENSAIIKDMFNLEGDIFFRKLEGGICNPPMYVYQMIDGKEKPVCVFKAELEDLTFAAHRFDALNEMNAAGFSQHPVIYKNKSGTYLSKFGTRHYYAIEYIEPDAGHQEYSLTFINMLIATGVFHSYSSSVNNCPGLSLSRLNMHQARQTIVYDPDLIKYDETFFNSNKWIRLLELYHFYSTSTAAQIIDALPKQFIIGDNNQTNIIYHHSVQYYIDLDERRYDVRLYDIGNLIRSSKTGAIDDYIKCALDNTLFDVINSCNGLKLNQLEKDYFHVVVAFTYIDFISWVLTKIKLGIVNNDPETTQSLFSLFKDRVDQVVKIPDAKLIDLDLLLTKKITFQSVDHVRLFSDSSVRQALEVFQEPDAAPLERVSLT